MVGHWISSMCLRRISSCTAELLAVEPLSMHSQALGMAFLQRSVGTGNADGSSIIAAKSGAFSGLHLVERDSINIQILTRTVEALPNRIASKICIHHRDCNTIIPELLVSDELDAARPCFAFLDQESTQLNWDTIETLASWKTYDPPPATTGRPKMCKVELWILFNSHQAIHRLWPHDRQKYPESFSPDTLDRVFGSREAWWDLWENRQPASALVFRFAMQLRKLGYQYVPSAAVQRSRNRSSAIPYASRYRPPQCSLIHAMGQTQY